MSKRGLSDVVTTVLIILLVVVAVVAIGAYVTNLTGAGGRALQREGACIANTVEVEGCNWFMASAYTAANEQNRTVVSITSSTDSAVAAITQLSYVFTYTDGKTETFTSVNSLPGLGKGAVSQDFTRMNKQPSSVAVGGSYRLTDGKTITCPAFTPASCLREATAQASYLAPAQSALNVAGSIGSGSTTPVAGNGSTGSGASASNSGSAGTILPILPSGYQCTKTNGVVTILFGQYDGATFIPSGQTPQIYTDSCVGTGWNTYDCATPTSSGPQMSTPQACATGCTGCPGGCLNSVCQAVVTLPIGLVAHWPLDNTLINTVSGGNALTVGSTSFPVPAIIYDTAGKKNQAYTASSLGSSLSGQYLKLNPATDPFSYQALVSRSFSVWFKLVNQGSYQGGVILSQASSADPGTALGYIPALYVDITTRQLKGSLFFHSSLGYIPLVSPAINDSNWHHAVITNTAGGIETLYLDGVQVATRTGAFQTQYTAQASAPYYYYFLGAGKGTSWSGLYSTNGFAGSIDEVRIYSTALTQADVTTLYNAGA